MSLRSFEESFVPRTDGETAVTHVSSPQFDESECNQSTLRATEQNVAIAILEAQRRQRVITEVVGLAQTWQTSHARMGDGWINDVTMAEVALREGIARLLHLRVAEEVIRNAISHLLRPNRTLDELLEAARHRVNVATA